MTAPTESPLIGVQRLVTVESNRWALVGYAPSPGGLWKRHRVGQRLVKYAEAMKVRYACRLEFGGIHNVAVGRHVVELLALAQASPTVAGLLRAAREFIVPEESCLACGGVGMTIEPRPLLSLRRRRRCQSCGGLGYHPEGAFCQDRLAVLSDAVEEAGCTDAKLLEGLRREDVAYCWSSLIDCFVPDEE